VANGLGLLTPLSGFGFSAGNLSYNRLGAYIFLSPVAHPLRPAAKIECESCLASKDKHGTMSHLDFFV
jgi:hypothetical protein